MIPATIKITERMLSKYLIDANKSVVEFVKSNLSTCYDKIDNGEKITHLCFFPDGEQSSLRIYRRPRGDKLLSIKNLAKRAKVGDTVILNYYTGDTCKTFGDGNLDHVIEVVVLEGEGS